MCIGNLEYAFSMRCYCPQEEGRKLQFLIYKTQICVQTDVQCNCAIKISLGEKLGEMSTKSP